MTGELRNIAGITINSTTNNVSLFTSPEFTRLLQGLLTISRSHPGAKPDIVALIKGIEDSSQGMPASRAPMIECEAVHEAELVE